jgi:chromate transporter
MLSVLAAVANALGVNELLVLFVAGLLSAIAHYATQRGGAASLWLPLISIPGAKALGGGAAAAFGLGPLFLFFLKVGSVLFGSGYVLLAFLRADLVDNWGWLTEGQLLDAIAVSQVTPGPVFTAATFIGYVLGGTQGAVVATLGIFIPAFFFVAVSGPLVKRIRRSPVAGAFLDGVVAASLALMAVVTWQLGRSALVDLPTALLGVASAVALLRYRVNSAWLILAGAIIGVALHWAGLSQSSGR